MARRRKSTSRKKSSSHIWSKLLFFLLLLILGLGFGIWKYPTTARQWGAVIVEKIRPARQNPPKEPQPEPIVWFFQRELTDCNGVQLSYFIKRNYFSTYCFKDCNDLFVTAKSIGIIYYENALTLVSIYDNFMMCGRLCFTRQLMEKALLRTI